MPQALKCICFSRKNVVFFMGSSQISHTTNVKSMKCSYSYPNTWSSPWYKACPHTHTHTPPCYNFVRYPRLPAGRSVGFLLRRCIHILFMNFSFSHPEAVGGANICTALQCVIILQTYHVAIYSQYSVLHCTALLQRLRIA